MNKEFLFNLLNEMNVNPNDLQEYIDRQGKTVAPAPDSDELMLVQNLYVTTADVVMDTLSDLINDVCRDHNLHPDSMVFQSTVDAGLFFSTLFGFIIEHMVVLERGSLLTELNEVDVTLDTPHKVYMHNDTEWELVCNDAVKYSTPLFSESS